MTAISPVTIRRARRGDVGVIVGMLADDPLGSGRERLEDPLPPSYFAAFDTLESASHIQLVVAEQADGTVVGCLQLCILPGLSSASANNLCNGPSRRPAPRDVNWSSYSRTTAASMRSDSTSGSDLRRAMSG
jgi:hypothetical protein